MTKISLFTSISLLVFVGYAGIAYLTKRIPWPPSQTVSEKMARNAQSRSDAILVPNDQSESIADRSLTQWIRQAVIADMSLSRTARRIEISTSNRVITLRGLVNSPAERERIEAKAQYIAGQNKVSNQLKTIWD